MIYLVAFVWHFKWTEPPVLTEVRVNATFPTIELCQRSFEQLNPDHTGNLACLTETEFAAIKVRK